MQNTGASRLSLTSAYLKLSPGPMGLGRVQGGSYAVSLAKTVSRQTESEGGYAGFARPILKRPCFTRLPSSHRRGRAGEVVCLVSRKGTHLHFVCGWMCRSKTFLHMSHSVHDPSPVPGGLSTEPSSWRGVGTMSAGLSQPPPKRWTYDTCTCSAR